MMSPSKAVLAPKAKKTHKNHIKLIKNREGVVIKYDISHIEDAVFRAFSTNEEGNKTEAKNIAKKVTFIVNRRFKQGEIPTVEDVQNIIEEVLILQGYVETARNYILYREQRRRLRESKITKEEAIDVVGNYLDSTDWEVKENSNMNYSLQGLNNYISNNITKRYWLNKIYPKEIRDASKNNLFHIHDLGTLGAYCCGWDLYDLLCRGFGGVNNKIQSKPPKHFRTALGQIINYFYTLQGEVAGAQAFSNFDTLLAPFIRYDNLNIQEVKQALQEFLFNVNVPTRVGFQTPFTNITLDLQIPSNYKDMPVVIGGQLQKETYKEFQPEMDVFNKILCEVFTEGDASGRVFTFPIPTYNITKDFDWSNPNYEGIWLMTAKYGLPYFSNFISSDMSPEDARSMCCRLRLDKRELYKRGGGLFGANPKTGSLGVVTVNLPRIAYLSKTRKDFFAKLKEVMDLAKESLEIKRKTIEQFTLKGLYPYCRYYLQDVYKMRGSYWANHFATIGLVGGNEACQNFLGCSIADKEGKKFMEEVLQFMRDILVEYQDETGNLYNLEATPAEGTSYRLAKIDKDEFPDIITAGEDAPYYTNSTQLPVNFTDDLFEVLDHQDSLQVAYTGGTVVHGFIGEEIRDPSSVKTLVKTIFSNYRLPYMTITPTFSVCPTHGYIAGEHFTCPKCVIEQPCEVYSRVVGYLRPVQSWHVGKQEEFKQRLEFNWNKVINKGAIVKSSKK